MFQETIVNDFTEQMFKKVDPNRLYLWDWMPIVGKSGGLLSGLKLDRFDVEVECKVISPCNIPYGISIWSRSGIL
jgi:hypothetical protein